MNDICYLTRFTRCDRKPDEEYAYWTEEQARHHMREFLHDDSGLYACVEVIRCNMRTGEEEVITRIYPGKQ